MSQRSSPKSAAPLPERATVLLRSSGEVLPAGGSWRHLTGHASAPEGLNAEWLLAEGAGGAPAALLQKLRDCEGRDKLPGLFAPASLTARSVWYEVTPLGDGPGRWEEFLVRIAPRERAAAPVVQPPEFDEWPDPALVLDEFGRILRLNGAAAALYGRAAHQCEGLSPSALPAASLLPADRLVALAREGGRPLSEWHLPGGKVAQARRSPLAGRPPRVLVTVREVTALVRHEAELNEQRQLTELGRLVAGVAHEVRNPLFAITATLANLKRELPREAGAARHLAALERQTARLTHLMEDLLQFSRPVAIPTLPGDLRELIEHTAAQVRRLARETGVEVALRVTGRLPPVLFDRQRLGEALLNLAGNALGFLPAGGKLWLEARAVEGGVRITVRDNGPGIAAELRERVFEPFFTTRSGGTGLGLAIVRRVMAAMGGRIEHRADYESGACFDLFLPAA